MSIDVDEELIRRLISLAQDLQSLRRGPPTPQQLRDAPVLRNWSIAPDLTRVLEGTVVGHPELGNRDTIRTSMLWALDRDQGWARTLSRFYILEPLLRRH